MSCYLLAFDASCWAATYSGVAFMPIVARSSTMRNSHRSTWKRFIFLSRCSFSPNCSWSHPSRISSCFSTSFFTMLKWPFCAAMNKGVAWLSVCALGSAAKANSKSTISWWPFWHAANNGVALFLSGKSTWAPCSSRSLTTINHPPSLAINKAVAPSLSLAPAQRSLYICPRCR